MKPFSETKVGAWLKEHASGILSTVENFVPQPVKGGLDIIKNIVSGSGIAPEKIAEFSNLQAEFEEEIIQLHNEEMANARSREIEITKTLGKKDNTLKILSVVGVIIPVLLLVYLIWTDKQINPLVAGFVGVIIGSYTQVFNYNFGSSSGSAKKQETIDSMM